MKMCLSGLLAAVASSAMAASTYTVKEVHDFSQSTTFGNPNHSITIKSSYPATNFNNNDTPNLVYPDWSTLPGGTTSVVADGSVILFAPPPDDVTVDWTNLKSLFLLNNNVIPDGTTLEFSDGEALTLWDHSKQTASTSGTTLTLSSSRNNNGVINFDVALNGGSMNFAGGRMTKMTGALTGNSTSSMVSLGNANASFVFEGALDFAGQFNCVASGNGSYFKLKPETLGESELYNIAVGCRNSGEDKAPEFLLFQPSVAGQTLKTRTLTTAENSGVHVSDTAPYYRQGGVILLPEGNRIQAQYLSGSMMHFLAETELPKSRASARTGTGRGFVDVTTECKSADNTHLCISTNISVSIAKLSTAVYFDYTTEPDGVNPSYLRITGSCNASAHVVATQPSMLPHELSGFAGTIELSATDWSFPVDFAAEEPFAAGCEGSGTLVAPASGTISITIANGDKAASGIYPLMTCTSGGEALTAAAWPASINGTVGEQLVTDDAVYTVVRDASGVSLKVKANSGLGLGVW